MFNPGSFAHAYIQLGALTKKIEGAQANIDQARKVNPDRGFQMQLDAAQKILDSQREAVVRSYERLAALGAEN